MNPSSLNIWCNAQFPPSALAELRGRVRNHRLILPADLSASNLVAGGADPLLADADIAFGQPDPLQSMQLPRLKWVHLTSAGYTRYDRDDLRTAFRNRGAIMTNSSGVYAEPCAQHLLAMMLSLARQLPQCVEDQRAERPWRAAEHRAQCRLLGGERVLILGFGAIARRLVELLQPLRMQITAVRRRPTGTEPCEVVGTERMEDLLPLADHVVNILPASSATEKLLDARRLRTLKSSAILYNIGRGTTIDQPALAQILQDRQIRAAYLDVTDPEPLPPDHPLWSAPNCYITPHTAGGHADEFERLVRHFAENLGHFERGEEMTDRII